MVPLIAAVRVMAGDRGAALRRWRAAGAGRRRLTLRHSPPETEARSSDHVPACEPGVSYLIHLLPGPAHCCGPLPIRGRIGLTVT